MGIEFYPGFNSPPNVGHAKLMEYIVEGVGAESPIMFGMHPNAEIGFRTDMSHDLFQQVFDLQPRSSGGEGGEGTSMSEIAAGMIEEIQDKIAEGVVEMEELISRIEAEGGRTPYVNVFYQEVQYMNTLILEMQRSLEVLNLGLLGELQMSPAMEELQISLFTNKVPADWVKVAFMSMRPLAGWIEIL